MFKDYDAKIYGDHIIFPNFCIFRSIYNKSEYLQIHMIKAIYIRVSTKLCDKWKVFLEYESNSLYRSKIIKSTKKLLLCSLNWSIIGILLFIYIW